MGFQSTGSTGSGNGICFICPHTADAPAAVPANPAPPAPITADPTTDDTNLVFTDSAYGGVIPIVFGSDLLAGNVIWASPFTKRTYTDGTTQKFYYSVNIAIAICEGVVNSLLRMYAGDTLVLDNTMSIDANGNPIPNPNGQVSTLTADLTSPTSPLVVLDPAARKTRITIFNGDVDQTPPAIMQQQEGYDYTPSYRGVAYLLIENLLISDSIPSLQMEVSVNTETLYPRQIGDYSNNFVLTQQDTGAYLAYFAGYDVVLSVGRNSDGSSRGFVVWNNNSLTVEKESVFIDPDGLTFNFDDITAQLLPGGNVLLQRSFLGGGDYVLWSPFYNAIVSSRLGGNGTGHHTADGPASTAGGVCVAPGIDVNGNACDVVVLPSREIGGVGLAIITITDGVIDYPYFSPSGDAAGHLSGDNFFEGGGYVRSATYTVPDAVSGVTPAFPDGGYTKGQHVIFFSTITGFDGIHVDRFQYDKTASPDVSVSTPHLDKAVAAIAYSDLLGGGNRLALTHCFNCPSDNTIILCCDATGSSSAAIMFKYDPLHARIVWKTAFGSSGSGGFATQPGQWSEDDAAQDVSNDKFAWVSPSEEVWTANLVTGAITKLFNLADQDLPAARTGMSMYLGKEDALIYTTTAGGGVGLRKVYLTRANRAQVALTTIVKSLLNRVDWRTADTEIHGIDTLAVDGYTISSTGYTLRQVFSDLQQVFTFDVVESNGEIVYQQRGSQPTSTFLETKMMIDDTGSQPWLQETHEYDLAGTRKIDVTYRDIDQQYKSNVQSVQLPKYSNIDIDADAAIQVQVSIVLDATTARKLAEILLYAKITYQTAYDGTLPSNIMPFDPSDVVTLIFNPADGLADVTMRMRQMSIGADWTVKINGTREDPDIYTDQINLFGTLGRFTPSSIPAPPSRVEFTLLQIPFWSEAQAILQDQQPGLTYPVYLTLTSLLPGVAFPADNITLTLSSGETYAVPPITRFPTWGYVVGTLPAYPELYTTDFKSTIKVSMISTDGALMGSCSDYYDMLNNRNKNLAVIGNEIIQFQTATDLGDGVFELNVIRRALFGTEDATIQHGPGDRFILLYGSDGLLDPRSVATIPVALGDGEHKTLTVNMPNTTNKNQPALIANYDSKQFRPWLPSAGQINPSGSDLIVSWKRRSRFNGQWTDSGDESGDAAFSDASPLVAVPEFDLYLTKALATFNPNDASTYMRKVSITDAETFTYTAAMQTEDSYDVTTELLGAGVVQTVNRTGLDNSLVLLFERGLRV